MKKLSNLVGTKEENQLFWIDKNPENSDQQTEEKIREKPILDFIAN